MNEHNIITLNAGLYLVPTPIGNLHDITLRALDTLKYVNLIAAEDTRHTRHLLQHFNIQTPLSSFHEHNEQEKTNFIINKIQSGQSIALVSDAGTPLINDPGYSLVSRCRQQGILVVPLPGACAAITALCASGLPTDRFCFEGFLPAKKNSRLQKLQTLEQESRTLIFYETKHRIFDCIQDIISVMGKERYVVLARELTKSWETIYGNTASALLAWIEEDEYRTKGEMVLIVAGAPPVKNELSIEIIKALTLLQEELPLKKACNLISTLYQVDKKQLYNYAISKNK